MSEDTFTVEVQGKRAPKPGPVRMKMQGGAGIAVSRMLWRIVWGFWRLCRPCTGHYVMLDLGYVLAMHGTPGKCCYSCSYLVIEGVRPYRAGNWDCLVFVMLPLNWSAIYWGLFDG